jgi:hypothetical protein
MRDARCTVASIKASRKAVAALEFFLCRLVALRGAANAPAPAQKSITNRQNYHPRGKNSGQGQNGCYEAGFLPFNLSNLSQAGHVV